MTLANDGVYTGKRASGEGYQVWWGVVGSTPPILHAIVLTLERQVLPAVRQTQGSKYADPRAITYNESQQGFHERVWGIMYNHDIPPFGAKDRLAAGCTIALPEAAAEAEDLDNLEKAVWDALQDLRGERDFKQGLYPNDKRIWGRLPGGKVALAEGESPWVRVRVELWRPD